MDNKLDVVTEDKPLENIDPVHDDKLHLNMKDGLVYKKPMQ